MLNLDHHLERLEADIARIKALRTDTKRMRFGDPAELAASMLRAAGETAVLFVQESIALQVGKPQLVPIGHGGPRS